MWACVFDVCWHVMNVCGCVVFDFNMCRHVVIDLNACCRVVIDLKACHERF